jgi:transcriptional regulator with PAS, ATPase and Fis domain
MGESGTGKEMFARAIHNDSSRRGKPFVAVNCAAIPEGLLESELFGYEEGSFTGAKKGGKIGKFEIANGGTIFLDEIGDMQLHMQTKLLRVLQDQTIERVGGQYEIPIDVRVIAATHKDLYKMMKEGEFRYDLFYRLNVIPLVIPPLRERKEDIPLIMKYVLQKCTSKLNKSIIGFSPEANDILLNYYWQGNIRELENTIEYAVNMENSGFISANNLPAKFKRNKDNPSPSDGLTSVKNLEKEAILNALNAFGYKNKAAAAKAIGMSRATFYRKLREYEIFSE